MVSQAAAFGFGEWGARGDWGQMTAEDQLIPSTLPLILGWNIFPDLIAIFIPDLTHKITAEGQLKINTLNTPINSQLEHLFQI